VHERVGDVRRHHGVVRRQLGRAEALVEAGGVVALAGPGTEVRRRGPAGPAPCSHGSTVAGRTAAGRTCARCYARANLSQTGISSRCRPTGRVTAGGSRGR
jgi:hypothetical protein